MVAWNSPMGLVAGAIGTGRHCTQKHSQNVDETSLTAQLDKSGVAIYKKKIAWQRRLSSAQKQCRQGWTLCLLDLRNPAPTLYTGPPHSMPYSPV